MSKYTWSSGKLAGPAFAGICVEISCPCNRRRNAGTESFRLNVIVLVSARI